MTETKAGNDGRLVASLLVFAGCLTKGEDPSGCCGMVGAELIARGALSTGRGTVLVVGANSAESVFDGFLGSLETPWILNMCRFMLLF